MAAIQTTQRELEAFFASALPAFLEYVKAHGTSVGDIELATSLDGISSLPALYRLGGVEKTVLAPLKLLTKDVDTQIEACKDATDAAASAASDADAAAKRVTDAVTDITAEKKAALEAAADAEAAAKECDTSREAIEAAEAQRQAAEDARNSSETVREAAETSRQEAEGKREAGFTASKQACDNATTQSEAQTAECKKMTAKAENIISHPDYIGNDGYWYEWNYSTQTYTKTERLGTGGVMYPTFRVIDNCLYVGDGENDNLADRVKLLDNSLVLVA